MNPDPKKEDIRKSTILSMEELNGVAGGQRGPLPMNDDDRQSLFDTNPGLVIPHNPLEDPNYDPNCGKNDNNGPPVTLDSW